MDGFALGYTDGIVVGLFVTMDSFVGLNVFTALFVGCKDKYGFWEEVFDDGDSVGALVDSDEDRVGAIVSLVASLRGTLRLIVRDALTASVDKYTTNSLKRIIILI